MSGGYPTRSEIPPDTRPVALVLSGLRRGALLVFLPVFVAGQAIAWLTYAVSGWYRPWSWFKIGVAEALASVRVGFVATWLRLGAKTTVPLPPMSAALELAVGALLIAVCVLAFRAGRDQARGLDSRPLAAAWAGSLPGVGFAIPMALVAIPVTLGFPQFGIDHLEPVLWQAFVLPLVVGGVCGAVGGLAAARAAVDEREPWGPRLAAAAHAGFTAFWWALALAFAGFLVVAALQPGPTGAYARFVDRTGGSGAALVVQHALLLPNQSSMILDTAMGVPTTVGVGDTTLARLSITGVDAIGTEGAALAGLAGARSTQADFPTWYWAFVLVPAAATIVGGRTAGGAARGRREAAARGALAGLVYAVLCTIAAWFAAIVLPLFAATIGGSVRLGTDPARTGLFALAWGVLGCTIGSLSLGFRQGQEGGHPMDVVRSGAET
jgi:hypothetical protein